VKYIDSDLLPNLKKVWWYGYGSKFQEQAQALVQAFYGHGLAAKLKGLVNTSGALRRKTRI